MPEWITTWLGEEDYAKIKPLLTAKIIGNIPEAEFELEFMEGNPEDSSRIYIVSKEPWYSKINDLLYSDEFCEWKNTLTNQYLSIYGKKIIADGVTDIVLGDFVQIDSDFDSKDKVGIVTSIMMVDGKKLFGCSYFCIELLGEFSWKDGLVLTEENYGGYHEGFEKILTLTEVQSILKENLTKEIEAAKQQIENTQKKVEKDIDKALARIIKRKEVQEIKRLRFKTYSDIVHTSLRIEPADDDEE